MKERFRLVEDYKHNAVLRQSLSGLAAATFGLGLEDWYRGGHWDGAYVPHSLAEGNRIAANVSTLRLTVRLYGKTLRAVQIGTVMTAPDCRGLGLSRRLLEHVLAEYRKDCDLIYLFANETVLDFYPRFGFREREEQEAVLSLNQPLPGGSPIRPLDLSRDGDRALLSRLAGRHAPVSPVLSAAGGNESLIWFYLGHQCPDIAFVLEGRDAIILLEREGETLFLLDILSERPLSLPEVLASVKGDCKEAVLGFLPGDCGLDDSLRPHGDHLFCLPLPEAEGPLLFPFLTRA